MSKRTLACYPCPLWTVSQVSWCVEPVTYLLLTSMESVKPLVTVLVLHLYESKVFFKFSSIPASLSSERSMEPIRKTWSLAVIRS